MEYSPLIDAFKDEVKNINLTGITGPHLPGVGNCYAQAKYKIAFCGWETYGWESLSEFVNTKTKDLVFNTDSCINEDKFFDWTGSNYHSTFWGFILKFLARFYNVDFSRLINKEYIELLHSYIWANSNSIERYDVSSSNAAYENWEMVKQASNRFDDLNHIINSCHPNVVFILYAKVKDEYFLDASNLSRIYRLDVNNKADFLCIQHKDMYYNYYFRRDSNTHIFTLPHPTWMGVFSGIGVDKYIESIIEDLKNYRVWDMLPNSYEDWVYKPDKSSDIFKYKLVASLANSLVKNDVVMYGGDLAKLFNINGILNTRGDSYSENGGKGIFRVISGAWNYYYNKGDYQTAYEIEQGFVKKNGWQGYDSFVQQ